MRRRARALRRPDPSVCVGASSARRARRRTSCPRSSRCGTNPVQACSTRTPLRAHCAPSSRVRLMSPPFDAAYPASGIWPTPTIPHNDATLTIEPPVPAPTIARAASRASSNGATRLTASVCANFSVVSSSAGTGSLTPALFTTTSMRPKCSRVDAASAAAAPGSARSHRNAMASRQAAATASMRSRRRAASTSRAPTASSTRANRAPAHHWRR